MMIANSFHLNIDFSFNSTQGKEKAHPKVLALKARERANHLKYQALKARERVALKYQAPKAKEKAALKLQTLPR